VYLELRYLLTECNDEGKYTAVEYDRDTYLSNRHVRADGSDRDVDEIRGPAVFLEQRGSLFSHDVVTCVRCLSWPPQAADWPTRHRNCDWPDSATVDRVVNNGCDVVHVAHRQCRQHEWMSKYQWRLSFSRAEIVLLNSWMPVQQIVYHMLRVFMKTERLTDSADNSGADKLSNYHIKTLMLWACEMKLRMWWTQNFSVVKISVELLHSLAVWLTGGHCPHYFINDCNLIDTSFDLFTRKMIVSRLMSITKSWLSLWFIKNYVQKCSQHCPHNLSRLFNDSTGLQNAISAVVDWILSSPLTDAWDMLVAHRNAIVNMTSLISKCSGRYIGG